MRSLMFASLFAAAMFFFAPDASASQQTQPAPQAFEEAPVDVEAERMFCPRRLGGPPGRRRMASCVTAVADEGQDFGAGTCAARYEHRGHRRVHLRLNQCRPLFQRHASSI
jgi:hypothetical protein